MLATGCRKHDKGGTANKGTIYNNFKKGNKYIDNFKKENINNLGLWLWLLTPKLYSLLRLIDELLHTCTLTNNATIYFAHNF